MKEDEQDFALAVDIGATKMDVALIDAHGHAIGEIERHAVPFEGGVILDFPSGQSIFTCSTQLVPYQRVHFLGTRGRIEIEVPFNAPMDRPTRLFIDDSGDLFGGGITTETFPVCDQYTLQGDAFSKAVMDGTKVPVSVEDAIENMAVIEALFNSANSGQWESPRR